MPVQGSTPADPHVGDPSSANPYGDYLSQFLSYITNPASYGSIPQIPDTTVNTSLVSPQTQLAGYPGLNQQASTLVGQQMAGKLPSDVIANLGTAGAERGVAMGSPGSPNANAAYLRALGLDTMQLQQQGLKNYNDLLTSTPRDTTTTQTLSNNILQALYKAAPDPMSARLAELAAQWLALQAGTRAGDPPMGGVTTTTPGTRTPPSTVPFTNTIGPSAPSGGTGPFTPPPSGGAPGSTNIFGPTVGGGIQPTDRMRGSMAGSLVIGADGNPWISNGDGTWTNASTGQVSYTDPSATGAFYSPDYGTTTTGGQSDTTYAPGTMQDIAGQYGLLSGQYQGNWQDMGGGNYYNPDTDEIMSADGNVYPAFAGNALEPTDWGYNQDFELGASGQSDITDPYAWMGDLSTTMPTGDTSAPIGDVPQEDWWTMPFEDYYYGDY